MYVAARLGQGLDAFHRHPAQVYMILFNANDLHELASSTDLHHMYGIRLYL